MKKMKKTINSLIAAACLLPAVGMAATTVTLNPVADAYVQGGNKADVNYGSAPELRAQTNNSPASNYDSYLRFDTSAIAEQVRNSYQSVTARLRVYAALSGSGTVSTSAHAVSDTTWSESAITWNTKPVRGSLLGSATVTGTAYAWQEIDVSTYVENEIRAGSNVISLGLHNGSTSSVYASANSREGANPPQLVITFNKLPTASITAPADGSVYTAPAGVTQSVDAADSDGSIAMVDFIMTENVSGADTHVTVTAPPYTHTWTNVAAGTYTLDAKVYDNEGAAALNPPPMPVSFTVNPPNVPPSVSLTAPTDGSSYTAPASITLTANATDSDGTIASVEFHDGATLIASLTAPPYSYTWNSVPAGSHSLTAKATDNQGATTTSAPATISVNAALASGVYYIHTDHLNTPRVITDASNRTVWRWDSDPFGAEKPNEDPDGDGAKFTYNLRFPGQYYDRETNLHYNYFRDYDPTTGRYVQSDPIGLEGGINAYTYVEGDPVTFIDPWGWERTKAGWYTSQTKQKPPKVDTDPTKGPDLNTSVGAEAAWGVFDEFLERLRNGSGYGDDQVCLLAQCTFTAVGATQCGVAERPVRAGEWLTALGGRQPGPGTLPAGCVCGVAVMRTGPAATTPAQGVTVGGGGRSLPAMPPLRARW